MRTYSRAIVVLVVITVIASLAACGSDKPKTEGQLTKAEYIEASDSICQSYQQRIASVVNRAGKDLSLEEAKETWNEKLIPLFQAELAELRRLQPPKADAALLDRALLAMASAINTYIGRVGGAKSIAQLNAIHPTGIPRWKNAVGEYGMTVCGSKN